MGSSVSRPTGRTSFSVISANASAALRWRSTLSEKESVVNAARGESRKKSVVVRSVALGRAEQDEMLFHVRREGVHGLRTFQVLKEICHGLPLVLQQQRFVC